MVAGQEMKIAEGDVAIPVWPAHVDDRLQRRHRHAHVRGMQRDAALASAEDGVHARPTLEGRASGARLALVASRGQVSIVGATRPLHQVAGDGGDVAQLRRGAGEQRLGERREALLHLWMRGDFAVGRASADPQAVGPRLDAAQIQPRDVHQARGIEHLQLHQIDERCPTGEEGRARPCSDCILHARCALVAEVAHQPLPRRRRTAAQMFGYAPQRQMLPLIPSRMAPSLSATPSASSATAERICPGVQ